MRLTTKKIESIVSKYINSTVIYLGLKCNISYQIVRPQIFYFLRNNKIISLKKEILLKIIKKYGA